MAQLLPNGRQQFLDANGNPLVGGLVYFYIPNTTTPKDTWQDAAKSALNTNPVVCDARGQATIYGDGDYRQILKDAAGNSIWDKTVSAPATALSVQAGSFMSAPDSGAANAYVITLDPAPTALTPGMLVVVRDIVASNTGASTLNVNGLGALPVRLSKGVALTNGVLVAGYDALLMLNNAGTAWMLVQTTGGSVYGFTPAQQGGGPNQNAATIIQIGYDTTASGVRVATNGFDQGLILFEGNLGTRLAAMAVDAIGAYGLFQNNSGTTMNVGTGTAGSSISWASASGSPGSVPAGNWICCGYATNGQVTLFRRVT